MACSKEKRQVEFATFQKWQRDLDRDYATMSWLDCSCHKVGGKKLVFKLRCKVCSEFVDRIRGLKNFSDKWIQGADSVRVSNVRDHAQNKQHERAMSLLRKRSSASAGLDPFAHTASPLVRAFFTLSDEEREKLRLKFATAYFVACENLPFNKYSKICELQAHNGVDLGTSYLNDTSGKEIIHYIAQSERQNLKQKIVNTPFFSLLVDGSTDKAAIDNELLLVVWCDINGTDERVHTRMDYLTIVRPESVSGEGLFNVLKRALNFLDVGIEDINPDDCKKLVGIGTDGASANIAAAGLKGRVENKLPWIYWMWCMAHRLELAVRDALKSTTFDMIDDLLLKLYYLYEKSPKKCRELEDIIQDLKNCFDMEENGIKPVRSSGSRWVSHKLKAMTRVISKYGAYTSHLATLSEDSSVKSADRAKLRGYYNKWTDTKCLLGCAFFTDLLTPCMIFSKCMQSDEVDILGALTGAVKTLKETNELASKPVDEWPTYSNTLKKCVREEDGSTVYQLQHLKRFDGGKAYFTSHYQDYCHRVHECIKTRLSWSDIQLMRDIITFLSSHGWEKTLQDGDFTVIDRLVERFEIPLEGAHANTIVLKAEFKQMLEYAVEYIALSTLDYHCVWWRLFNAPNSAEWTSALTLARLLFSLPASNGKLERAFSLLKSVKTDRRTRLTNESLDDLLRLLSSKVPLKNFNPDGSIDSWWMAKRRRLTQSERKEYRPRNSEQSTSTELQQSVSEDMLQLDQWDELMV